MKRPGPCERIGHDAGFAPKNLGADALDAAAHFGRGPAGKGHQQGAARIGAADDQMGDSMRQRVRLAGTRSRDDQQRTADRSIGKANPMLHGSALFAVQCLQMRRAHECPDIFLLFFNDSPTPFTYRTSSSTAASMKIDATD
jgi:hypothetical protein